MNVIFEDSKVNRIGMYELKAQGLYTVYAVMPGQLKVWGFVLVSGVLHLVLLMTPTGMESKITVLWYIVSDERLIRPVSDYIACDSHKPI